MSLWATALWPLCRAAHARRTHETSALIYADCTSGVESGPAAVSIPRGSSDAMPAPLHSSESRRDVSVSAVCRIVHSLVRKRETQVDPFLSTCAGFDVPSSAINHHLLLTA